MMSQKIHSLQTPAAGRVALKAFSLHWVSHVLWKNC